MKQLTDFRLRPHCDCRQTSEFGGIDLLGRTYGVIHTAPDPDAGNNPRIVTALAHAYDLQGRRKSARREDGTTWQYDYNTRSEVTGAEKRQSNSGFGVEIPF
jgi:YD repeat-containing protein